MDALRPTKARQVAVEGLHSSLFLGLQIAALLERDGQEKAIGRWLWSAALPSVVCFFQQLEGFIPQHWVGQHRSANAKKSKVSHFLGHSRRKLRSLGVLSYTRPERSCLCLT